MSNEFSAADPAAGITRCLIDYATALDTKDWALFRECFTDVCEVRYPPSLTTDSADELTSIMKAVHDPLDGCMHRITNVSIDLTHRHFQTRSYVDAILVRDLPGGSTLRVMGWYDDHLTFSGSRWRIMRRTFHRVAAEGNPAISQPPAPGE